MILIVHEGNPALPEDVAAARERIHPATMAAEGPLHDLGAISIINSDSQGMGRIGETVRRTWQLAHVMKAWRASEAGSGWPNEPADDNERVLRYLAKYTVEPARVHGIARRGRLARTRATSPTSSCGIPPRSASKPLAVMKGGAVAWGPIGEGNASCHGAEPTRYGPDWGATGDAAAALVDHVRLRRPRSTPASPRRSARGAASSRFAEREASVARDLVANTAVPPIEVSRIDGTVTLDGRVLAAEPVDEVPLNRRYLLT